MVGHPYEQAVGIQMFYYLTENFCMKEDLFREQSRLKKGNYFLVFSSVLSCAA